MINRQQLNNELLDLHDRIDNLLELSSTCVDSKFLTELDSMIFQAETLYKELTLEL